MNNLQMWTLIVGFFLPLAIALVQRRAWGNAPRAVVGFLCCIVAAAGTCWFNGGINLMDFVTSALTVVVTSLATFSVFWNKLGATNAIESLTNGKASSLSTPPKS